MKKLQKIVFRTKRAGKLILYWPCSSLATQLAGSLFYYRKGRPTAERKPDSTMAERILVVRLDEIGDVVLTIPLLRELRRNLSQAWITLVVKPEVFNLVELCPYVNEVLIFDWSAPKSVAPYLRHWRALKLARRHLWPRHFDLALLPRWDADNHHAAMLAYFSGAPIRVGYSERVNKDKQIANQGLDYLLTHALDHREPRHEVLRSLEFLRFLGGTIRDQSLELWITGEDEDFARHLLESQGYHGKDFLIALVPGAAQKGKQWPLANFIDLGSKLIKEYQAWIVVIGGKTDEALGQGLKKGLGEKVIDATGQTTLRQAAAVLSHCDLYVGNDSGPMHLAAAMQVPVVEISRFPTGGRPLSPQAPARFEPWGVPHRVLQPDRPAPPCHGDSCMAEEAHCIRRITVEQVEIAIADLLRLKRGIS